MDTSDSEAFESADEDFEVQSNRSSDSYSEEVQSIVDIVSKTKISETPKEEVVTLESIETELKCDFNTELEKHCYETHNVVKKGQCEYRSPTPEEKFDSNLNVSLNKSDTNKNNVEVPKDVSSVVSGTTNNTEETGWDDDVEWTAIEDSEKEVDNLKKDIENTGWDDFDAWEPIENTQETPTQKTQSPSKDEENIKPILERLTNQPEKSSSWGGWGGWDVTKLISTASDSVQSFTNHVSQGLTTVLETGIGVPSPEDLAMTQKLEREKSLPKDTPEESVEKTEPQLGFGFGDLLTGVTKLVETTGSKVVTTGLDTLEVIGKKTMEVLQEGDPGLIKKRALLRLEPEKPSLSQVLREAKNKAEMEDQNYYKGHEEEPKKVHYETLFDDHQGLVHLEALEMLSKQCDIQLATIIESSDGKALEDIQETILQVKELCELPDEEDEDQCDVSELKNKLNTAIDELQIPLSFDKLYNIWEEAENEIKTGSKSDVEVHQYAIETLAQLTAAGVEQFHKCAELLLVKQRRSTADEADSLVQITSALTSHIGIVADKFSEKLNNLASTSNNPDINGLITNVFFEATQSSSYIQDAFQLFIPILQVGAI